MDISWEDIRLLLAIAEERSLSGAARKLRIGQPTVSRRLAQLEHEVGGTLFRRQATGVALTPAAERLVAPARHMAEFAGEFERAASQEQTAPSGWVRIAAPPGVAFEFLAPFAGWLRQTHPELRLELLSSIEYLDLARGDAHLALRMRAPTDGDLTVVGKLAHANAVMVSRKLAATLPKRPHIAQLDWIAWPPSMDHVPPNPQMRALIPHFVPRFTSDNFLIQLEAARSGVGAMVLGHLHHRFSRHDDLVPLDIDLGPYARSELFLVAPRSALGISRVLRVAELLKDELARLK
jgi:DNA-binding transcriptional LysR family regulator